ncbi:MAG: hypothetical protein ACYCUG_03505 [Acidimicrobiales bacterium]
MGRRRVSSHLRLIHGARQASRAPDAGPDLPTPNVERCREHIGALYVLAYLRLGDRPAAEDAVVDAVVSVGGRAEVLGPAQAWSAAAGHIDARPAPAFAADEAGSVVRRAALRPHQRRALALLVAGRKPREAAELLGVSVADVYRMAHEGMQALHTAGLPDPPPGVPT